MSIKGHCGCWRADGTCHRNTMVDCSWDLTYDLPAKDKPQRNNEKYADKAEPDVGGPIGSFKAKAEYRSRHDAQEANRRNPKNPPCNRQAFPFLAGADYWS